ncbi:MAG: hypothetical protein NTY88_12865 [Bacteroidetes bacterium]|nr:hypothetical protein [Bacteroidota bacterium]
MTKAGKLSKEVGHVALPDAVYELVKKRFVAGTIDSAFAGKNNVGVKTEDLDRKKVVHTKNKSAEAFCNKPDFVRFSYCFG